MATIPGLRLLSECGAMAGAGAVALDHEMKAECGGTGTEQVAGAWGFG